MIEANEKSKKAVILILQICNEAQGTGFWGVIMKNLSNISTRQRSCKSTATFDIIGNLQDFKI